MAWGVSCIYSGANTTAAPTAYEYVFVPFLGTEINVQRKQAGKRATHTAPGWVFLVSPPRWEVYWSGQRLRAGSYVQRIAEAAAISVCLWPDMMWCDFDWPSVAAAAEAAAAAAVTVVACQAINDTVWDSTTMLQDGLTPDCGRRHILNAIPSEDGNHSNGLQYEVPLPPSSPFLYLRGLQKLWQHSQGWKVGGG